MKKDQIKVGEVYTAKVSDKVVSVRIDSENPRGGWNATNLSTGKTIRIKTAQRLRAKARGKKAPGELEIAIDSDNAAADGQPGAAKKARKAKKDGSDPKRTSALDAAAQVLQAAGTPMRCKDLIATMAAKGLWTSPGGKTPEATLYSAILREIGTKGNQARFRKTERGHFTYAS